jgi:putative sterol carrier protein
MRGEHRLADQHSIAGSFAGLQAAFQPDRAQGVNKTVQFDFTGREAGTWTASVHDGQFEYHEGAAENPNVTVAADSDDWLAILRSELNGVSAFMSGKLKAQGDLNLMMQFQNWFAQ